MDNLKIPDDLSAMSFREFAFIPAENLAVILGEPRNTFDISRTAIKAVFVQTSRSLPAGKTGSKFRCKVNLTVDGLVRDTMLKTDNRFRAGIDIAHLFF
jgi:hypothetical protein